MDPLKPWDVAAMAERLDGREYREEISADEELAAKESGLLVVFGASDDLVEFRGVEKDDLSAFGGVQFRVDALGCRWNWEDVSHDEYDEMKAFFEREELPSIEVHAKWDVGGFSWYMETEAEHAEFTIWDEGQPYCRGIVIDCTKIAELVG